MKGKVVEIEGVAYKYVKTKYNNCFKCDFFRINELCLKAECGNNYILKEVVKNGEELRRSI